MAIFEPGDYEHGGGFWAIVAIVIYVSAIGLYFLARYLYDTRERTGDGND